MTSKWREHTLDILADSIGPAADIVIDLSLDMMPNHTKNMSTSRDYLVFLKQLKKNIPEDISPDSIEQKLWLSAVDNNIFN